jgi:alpha-D-xyloside xylohydrolase
MNCFFQEDNSLCWTQDHETLRIEPWGADSLRVRATLASAIREELDNALLSPPSMEAQIDIQPDQATIRNGAIVARVSAAGEITFLNAATSGELLREAPPYVCGPLRARHLRPVDGDLARVEMRFAAYDDERIYGLGQHQHGRLDQKGCIIDLVQHNTEVNIPFLLSSRGYGFLWNNPAIGRVELGGNATRWIARATPQLDYWITAGETPAAILARYADATGHAPLLPDWAAGFWQSKLRYRTQEELLEVAREYRRRGLPLSVIVADFFHWTRQGDWRFDPAEWPDPAGMVRELESMGVKLMVSIWPTVALQSQNYPEMNRRGFLIRTKQGVHANFEFVDKVSKGPTYVHYYDATHPDARDFVWEQVRENYYERGVRVWWLDACEPEIYPLDHANLVFHEGDGAAVANLYPLRHAQGFYEGMQAEGEEAIVLLARSAWAGSQRYGVAVWSGDIESSFESLRAQAPAGLNMAMSGIPWWTTDIGGFHGGDPDDPVFRELLVRWFQYGVFCPLFRLHGVREQPGGQPSAEISGGPNEVWSYGDEIYALVKDLLFLRERLRPYVMAQMAAAHETGAPVMRPLFFDFPQDERSYGVADQFMFGPDLLVAPVLHAGARERRVYLPAGASWADGWTGERFQGGRTVTATAPLERIPLFLRDGARLPIRA